MLKFVPFGHHIVGVFSQLPFKRFFCIQSHEDIPGEQGQRRPFRRCGKWKCWAEGSFPNALNNVKEGALYSFRSTSIVVRSVTPHLCRACPNNQRPVRVFHSPFFGGEGGHFASLCQRNITNRNVTYRC